MPEADQGLLAVQGIPQTEVTQRTVLFVSLLNQLNRSRGL